jgi:Domain of unknown function (DUF4249)
MRRDRIHFISLTVAVVSATLLLSCEDVIKVNLKNVTPRLVIEGSVSNISDSVIIMLHKTTDYYNPAGITSVNDAEVVVTDSDGNAHQFTMVLDGIYAAGNFMAKPGDIFDLDVTEGGVKYNAGAKMPVLVKIDTVIIDKNPDRPTEDRVNVLIDDPAGIANYYQLEIFRNDSLLNNGNNFILYNDKYFDGKPTYFAISGRRLGINEFNSGDKIRVRLINIEKSMYDYYDVLRSITSDQILSASTPSNPPNNLSGDGLGYFAAWSICEKTIIKD